MFQPQLNYRSTVNKVEIKKMGHMVNVLRALGFSYSYSIYTNTEA